MAAIPVLAFVLLAVSIPAVAGDVFTDGPDSNIFHDDIAWLAEKGVTRGCNPPANTEFCPGDAVTRQHMAAFLHRLSGWVLVDATIRGNTSLEAQIAAANLAAAAYQDVSAAEADGYVNTLGPGEGSLGCFEDPARGGMGVHYLRPDLLEQPEALVYELDRPERSSVWWATSTESRSMPGPVRSRRRCWGGLYISIPCCRSTCCTRGSGRTTRAGCSRTSTRRSASARTVSPCSARTPPTAVSRSSQNG